MSWWWLVELLPTMMSSMGVYVAMAGRVPDWMLETRIRTPRSARLIGLSYVAMGGAWAALLAQQVIGFQGEWIPLLAVAVVFFTAQITFRLRAGKHADK